MSEPDPGSTPSRIVNAPFRLDPSIGGSGILAGWLRARVEHALGLSRLQALYDRRPRPSDPRDFLEWWFRALGVRPAIDHEDLARVPESGPVLVVANHPYGAIEGMILAHAVTARRSDVRVLANYFLGRIPEIRDRCVLVDPFDRQGSVHRNIAPMRHALRWLKTGGALVTFPAGEVSHLQPRRGCIEDPPWSTTLSGLVRRARCPVVPVHFSGNNSVAFQLAGLVHSRLRTAMLARELLRRRGTTIEARIGNPVPFRQLDACGSDREMVDYLRGRTYILRERPSLIGTDRSPVQPRVTPRNATPVAAPSPTAVLEDEVARLPPNQQLVDGDDQVVYVAEADQIPCVLREIGRLRELTFRAVGEGTGRELDLDTFDARYRHLFIWSRRERHVVGAYRLGLTDRLMLERGLAGLYTSTLFDYGSRLFDEMGPALEMGRSFIRLEHQKSYVGLLLLWKGIGRFVVDNPGYATLFGPVSISADYQSASQQLIVAFLEQNNYSHDWARWVRPRAPHRPPRRSTASSVRLARLETLEDVSEFIAEIESDHKGVPILLKQYLKLGGRLLGFNVDPAFADVLDVLIMVDLRQTARKILARYMGRDGAASFLAHHARTDSRAS